MTPAEKFALVQRSYDVFNAGMDIDALMPLYHPALDWRMGVAADAGTDPGRGHDGLRALVAAIGESFESLATAIDEARVTREGVLLLRNHGSYRSRGTHEEHLAAGWQEVEFRDGLISTVMMLDESPAGWDQATPVA